MLHWCKVTSIDVTDPRIGHARCELLEVRAGKQAAIRPLDQRRRPHPVCRCPEIERSGGFEDRRLDLAAASEFDLAVGPIGETLGEIEIQSLRNPTLEEFLLQPLLPGSLATRPDLASVAGAFGEPIARRVRGRSPLPPIGRQDDGVDEHAALEEIRALSGRHQNRAAANGMSNSQCHATVGVLGGEYIGDTHDVLPEILPAVAVSTFGLRGFAVPPRVHRNHAIMLAQPLRNGTPHTRAESGRVVEQCQRTLTPPIEQRNLDRGIRKCDFAATNLAKHESRSLAITAARRQPAGATRYAFAMGDGPTSLDEALRVRVEANLSGFRRLPVSRDGLRPAAVALALLANDEGESCFVLTLRAAKMKNHASQYALPGGRLDPGETAEQAALRELSEEVGLELPPASVLGILDDYPTRSGFVITPVVVWAGAESELKPNPQEVAEVYRVRLEELGRPGVPNLRNIPESPRPVISIPLVGTDVHAPTAAILYQLHEVAIEGRETRVVDFEQPVFAWR